MADVSVRPVTSRRDKKRFLEFPWTVYRDDPLWIPPLRQNQKEAVGYRRHAFYENNEIQTFLGARHGQTCGRIAAIVNNGHIERFSERRGFFGFFECVDDQQVANALFDAARSWFAERDIRCMRGPTNPSLNYEAGLLVDGFDSSPTFMMTYNPRYYETLVENYGFKKTQDLYAYWGHIDMLPKVQEKLSPICGKIIKYCDAKLRPLDTSRFRQEVEAFLDVYNKSLSNTWGFVPMTTAEVRQQAAGMKQLLVPELAQMCEVDGRVVGAVFGLPDYNPRIREIDGRLFPFGFLHLLRKKHEIKKIRVISTNVLPEFQLSGLGLVLLDGLAAKIIEWGIQEVEFSWVLESNSFSRGSLEKGGAKLTKTYRLYDFDE